ncbi:MAG: hypothetical protein G01um101418_235, partial [Parcubacteria group bacterium Gr01-1014_18]
MTNAPQGLNGAVPTASFTGGAGTVYLEETDVHTVNQGILIIDNLDIVSVEESTLVNSTLLSPNTGTFAQIRIKDKSKVFFDGNTGSSGDTFIDDALLTMGSTLSAANLTLSNSAQLTHFQTSSTVIENLTLNITGILNVDATSTIDVSARGFLGGGKIGASLNGQTSNGSGGQTAGTGPVNAGSHGGLGGRQASTNVKNSSYDSIINPSEPGGGGGNNSGTDGNNGGGIVIITAGTLTLAGTIKADGGGVSQKCGGAGGTVKITATTIGGTGSIQANGGLSTTTGTCGNTANQRVSGGGGRVAIRYATNSGLFTIPPTNILANAPQGTNTSVNTPSFTGGTGTVYLEETDVHATDLGILIIDSADIVSEEESTPLAATETFGDIYIKNKAEVLGTTINAVNLNLINDGRLRHLRTTTSTIPKLTLNITGTLLIDGTTSLDVTGKGFLGGSNSGASVNGQTSNGAGGQQAGTDVYNGGSHGGLGGQQIVVAKNPVFDSILNPSEPGGGGSNNQGANLGNDGGGVVFITAGTLTVNGSIKADGEGVTVNCGGAGGTIRITATTLGGSGSIQAKGGLTASPGSCATGANHRISGGGGRIAIRYVTNSGLFTIPPTNILVNAAQGTNTGASTASFTGGSGTLYLEQTGVHGVNQGLLIVDNVDALTVSNSTPLTATLLAPNVGIFQELRIKDKAQVQSIGNLTTLGDFLIDDAVASFQSTITAANLTLANTATLTLDQTTGNNAFNLFVDVSGTVTVPAGSTISATGKGFQNGFGPGFQAGNGGNHGGKGGGNTLAAYDSLTNPIQAGSGGAGAAAYGGGIIRIDATNIVLGGTIEANGA